MGFNPLMKVRRSQARRLVVYDALRNGNISVGLQLLNKQVKIHAKSYEFERGRA